MRNKNQWCKIGAMLLALALLIFAAGCKKKVPPPPPPPAAPPPVSTPTAPKPVISSFTAEPTTIEKGQSSTLRWSISGATDMTIDQGIGPVQSSGSRQVFPANSTTYTLVANGPGGSDTRSVTVEVTTPPPPPPPPATTVPTLSTSELLSQQGQDVYFDYDKSDIRADQQATVAHDADLLKRIFQQDPSVRIQVEGHCDERGSAEYNLALGDRRATADKDALVALGVPGDRLTTISYGKERPQCTEATEECYQKNRRAHLSVAQ